MNSGEAMILEMFNDYSYQNLHLLKTDQSNKH